MVRKIDAEHLKSRIMEPKDDIEKTFVDGLIQFINDEPTYEDPKELIQWIPDKREKNSKDCRSVTYGFRCSCCGYFTPYETKYCSECGGKYNGEIKKNIKNRFRR